MNIIGNWKIAQMLGIDENFNPVWKTAEELLEGGDDYAALLSSTMQFTDDGSVLTVARIPEGTPKEELDAAAAAGELELCGDMIILERKRWKEEDGKLLYDTGVKGEVLGEAVSPWVEVKFADDMMELPMMRLIRE